MSELGFLKNIFKSKVANYALPLEDVTMLPGFPSLFPLFCVCLRLSLLLHARQIIGKVSLEAPNTATLVLPMEETRKILCFRCGIQFLLFAPQKHVALNILFKKANTNLTWCLLMNCKLALQMEIFIFQFI